MNRLMNHVRKFMTNMIKSSRTHEFRDFGQGSFCVKLTRPVVNLKIFLETAVNHQQQNKASSLVLLLSYQPGWWDDSISCCGKSWCEHDVMTWFRKRQRKRCPSLIQLTPEHTYRSQLRCKTRSTENLNISRIKRYIIRFVACYSVLTHSLQFPETLFALFGEKPPMIKLNIDCLSVCFISLCTLI